MASQLDSICRSLQFIEQHLRERISVADMAAHCGYSIFHFIRLFNTFAHQTPYDYLIRRRLSEACQDLQYTDNSITRLAYDYCFETPESFSRAFKRVFGALPSDFRAGRSQSGSLPIPPKTRRDLEFTQQQDFTQPRLVDREEMTLAGIPLPAVGADGSDYKNAIEQLKVLRCVENADISERIFLVTSYTDDPFAPSHRFIAAADRDTAYPPPISLQHISAGSYICLSYPRVHRESALRYLFYTWLSRAGLSHNGCFFIEELVSGMQLDTLTTLVMSVYPKIKYKS